MAVRESADSPAERLMGLARRAQETRVARVIQRFSSSNGPLLASGMAYQSLFALFAAVWVVFSIAGIWVRSDQVLYDQLITTINHAVPNLVGNNGAISLRMLDEANTTLSITGLIALVGLAWTALGWLASTRTAIRVIFGVGNDQRNFFVQKAVDAVQALGFGLGLVASALVSLLTRQFFESILGYAGFDPKSTPTVVALNTISIAITVLINFGTLSGMYRVLSQLYIPWRNLIVGAAIGAIALTVLSQASSYLLRGASRNPLLASFAVFVGLLLWFNFVCQVILIAGAWISVGMEDRGLSTRRLSAQEAARERMREEYARHLEEAREEVRAASEAYELARGWRNRHRARGAMLRAMRHLQAVTVNDPDLREPERTDATRRP